MQYQDLNLFQHPSGFEHRELFPNGYGVSVTPEEESGLYRIQVISHTQALKLHLSYRSEKVLRVISKCPVDVVDSLIFLIKKAP